MSESDHARRLTVRTLGVRWICVLGALSILPSPTLAQGSDLDSAVALHWRGEEDSASALLLGPAIRGRGNAAARAWLAEITERGEEYRQAVFWARAALELDSCQAFAHEVLARVYNPEYSVWNGANRDSTWEHAQRAVRCAPDDGNAWMELLLEAMHRDSLDMVDQVLQAFDRTGFFTRSVRAYDRATLNTLPRGAIIVMGGDLDFIPSLMEQRVEGLRKDAVIVSFPMLNALWYPGWLHDTYGLPVPPVSELDTLHTHWGADSVVAWRAEHVVAYWRRGATEGWLGRPLTWAVTVRASALEEGPGALRWAGPWTLLDTTLERDTADVDAAPRFLAALQPDDFAGTDVSPQDRSVVRRAQPKMTAMTTAAIAAGWEDFLRAGGDTVTADSMLGWLHHFGGVAGIPQWIDTLMAAAPHHHQ